MISIHAPLAGSDDLLSPLAEICHISIHAPLAGSDGISRRTWTSGSLFQSTLPLRGATRVGRTWPCSPRFQSTLPLRGATPYQARSGYRGSYFNPRSISIHAPLAGSDRLRTMIQRGLQISIHAPLAGSDPCRLTGYQSQSYFNPRSPCGERLFLLVGLECEIGISIHAPLAGSDQNRRQAYVQPDDFNPRSPCGERPAAVRISLYAKGFQYFNPRSPCGERLTPSRKIPLISYFNPRSPCGERHATPHIRKRYYGFQSTLPLRGATLVYRHRLNPF